MPLYDFECGACGATEEVLVRSSDTKKPRCPACGSARFKRAISAPSIITKGGAAAAAASKPSPASRRACRPGSCGGGCSCC